jgi:uncharacterized protein YjbI with pentapeptide repeats
LTNANLSRAQIEDAIFIATVLAGANLSSAHLINTDFTGADLSNANFDRAHLVENNFTDADLTGAILTNAIIMDNNFDGADLSGVNLSGSVIKDSSFEGALLLGADLSDIKNGTGVSYEGAFYDQFTIFGIDFDLTGLVFLPEPSSNLLVSWGLIGLTLARRRKRLAARKKSVKRKTA